MLFSKYLKYAALGCSFVFFHLTAPYKIILFDMNGVFTKTNQTTMALQEIGATHLFNMSIDMMNGYFSHFFFDNQPPFMKKRLFQTLERIGDVQTIAENEKKATNKGLVLPQIMCDWMSDKHTPTQIHTMICEGIKKLYKEGFFMSSQEMRYIRKILLMMFSSEVLVRHTQPVKEGIKLLHDLARRTKKRGKGLIFGILSNAASEPFTMKQNSSKLNTIFKYMHKDYIFVSGKIGTIKPYSSIYKYVIEKLKNDGIINDASEIIFIDDQEENVVAAQKQGITTLHLKNFDYKTLRKQLHKLGVL